MTSKTETWTFVVRLPQGGHRIFRNQEGRYAVADDSGRAPHTTDDGVLYLDFLRPLELQPQAKASALVPLTLPDGSPTATVESVAGMLVLASLFEWSIVVPDGNVGEREFAVKQVRPQQKVLVL